MGGANYERGIVLYQSKQFKHAEKEFRQELVDNPHYAPAHAMLGMTLTALRKADQGHKEALESVRLIPSYPYGHYTLSFTFAALSKPKEAEKAIIEAIRLDPEEAYLFARASQIYFGQKKYAKSLEMADLGLAQDAEHEECLINRAASLLELNRLDEAQIAVEQALLIAPTSSTAHINAGALWLRRFDHVKAFEHYREALRLNPNSDSARIGVVESLKAKNKLYHFLLKISLWYRRLPPWAIAVMFLFVIPPPTRFIIIAVALLCAFANRLFEMSLHLDPVGKDFVKDRSDRGKQAFKTQMIAWCVIVSVFLIALAVAFDKEGHRKHGHMQNSPHHKLAVKEPVDNLTFSDYDSYMKFVQKRIYGQWLPPSSDKDDLCKVMFAINKDGTLGKYVAVQKPSRSDDLDQSCVEAIKRAEPFPTLPPHNKRETVDIEFTFEYKAGPTLKNLQRYNTPSVLTPRVSEIKKSFANVADFKKSQDSSSTDSESVHESDSVESKATQNADLSKPGLIENRKN